MVQTRARTYNRIMAGTPERKIRLVAGLVEWHKELSNDFRKLLPGMYRYRGVNNSGDARRDAWSNCDRLIATTAKALTELERVLRTAAMERAKPRGNPPKYTRVGRDAGKDERIGTPMYVDE